MDAELLELPDVTIRVARTGPPSAPAVLLLHGEDGTLFCRPFIDALAEQFQVIVPSHPGWGGEPPDHVRTIADIAQVYLQLLARQDLRVPVVGLSLGGWIAAEMAAMSTAGIERLALVSPIGIKVGGRNDRDFVDIYEMDPEHLDAVLHGTVPERNRLAGLSDDELTALAVANEAVMRFAYLPYMHDPTLPPRLRRVEVPVLVVSGTEERFVLNPNYYARYCELFGSPAQNVAIEGAGHRTEEDEPGLVAKHVAAFLGMR